MAVVATLTGVLAAGAAELPRYRETVVPRPAAESSDR